LEIKDAVLLRDTFDAVCAIAEQGKQVNIVFLVVADWQFAKRQTDQSSTKETHELK